MALLFALLAGLAGCNISDGTIVPAANVPPVTGQWLVREEIARISGERVLIAELWSARAVQQSRKKSYRSKISIFCQSGTLQASSASKEP